MKSEQKLSLKKIFVFWLPLAATWLMMSVEGPFIAAIIARLADPKFNLAAYGVAFALALIIEAPIIMILSAATALVKNRQSFQKLKNYTYLLNGAITALMLVLIVPKIFFYLTIDLMELPGHIARLTHISVILLLPWPGAIGYRRFYQGILIRNNYTRRVAYGTIIRLLSMTGTALFCYYFYNLPGAYVGATALSVGVLLEALASRLMAQSTIKKICAQKPVSDHSEKELTFRSITKFYYPLALTSLLGLAVHPMLTFFVGQSRFAIESLAVLPVINSLVFIFRSLGLSYQEVAITFMGKKNEGYAALRNFAAILMGFVTVCLALIAFTPAADFWFFSVSGLTRELTGFALIPTRILTILPALSVLISFQRAVLVNSRKTGPITTATAIEVSGIIVVLGIGIYYADLIGAVAASIALMVGRVGANIFLMFPFKKHISNPKK